MTFVDLGDESINLDAICMVQWSNSYGRVTVHFGTNFTSFEGEKAERLRLAFKQVPHIPVMGAHAKAIS